MRTVIKISWIWLLFVVGFVLVACGGEEEAVQSELGGAEIFVEAEAESQSQSEPEATTAVVSNVTQNGVIIPNVDIQGVATSGMYNYTAVEAVSGQRFNIYATPAERLDIVVDVVDTNGDSILPNGPVDQSYQTEAILDLAFDKTGTYYIAVYPYDDNVEGSYTLRIEYANGDAATQPESASETEPEPEPAAHETWVGDGLIPYGVDTAGYIPAQGASYWSFAGSPGDVFNIFVTPEEGLDIVVNVFDSAGHSLLPNGTAVDETSSGEEFITGIQIPVDSTYTVAITDYNGRAGSYSLRVAEVSQVGATGEEYGNIFGGAGPYDRIEGPVTSGGPYIGTIPEFGAASVWGLRRFPGDVLSIRIDPLAGQDVVIDIREGITGQSIFEDGPHDMEYGSELITGLEFPNGGDFSIVVYGFTADDVGEYELYIIEGE